MIPSKFGMAPVNIKPIVHHSNFGESNNTIFATPNNSQSNQKYISELVKTADPAIPIQTEREDKILKSGIPKICYISFSPQGNEFFFLPIAEYFIANRNSAILSYFIVPDEPCNIYFECEDPNKLLQCLKLIPELSELKLTAQILPSPSDFIQLFCNFNSYCHIQAGRFVKISNPEFEGDFAQVISVNKESKKCLLKLIPRIDYENLGKYHLTTQTELNDLMPVNYRPPKALFDRNKLYQINSNTEFKTKKIKIGKSTEIELVVWSGKKFYGSFQYKNFHFDAIKTIIPKISLDELEIFRKNIYLNEKFIRGFVDTCEHLYKNSFTTQHNSSGIENDRDDVKNDTVLEKPVLRNLQSSKSTKKKKSFFPISSFNDLTKFEEKKEPKIEKKIESKIETKIEEKIEPKNEVKAHEKPNSKILPGTKVIPNYGQYAGLVCKVKSNNGKIIIAEIDDSYISTSLQDFSLEKLYKEEPIEKNDISIQVTPPKPEKVTHKSKTKSHNKHQSKNSNIIANDMVLKSTNSQTEQEFGEMIPRENDLVELENKEPAMIIDDSNILPSSTGIKRKIKGGELFFSKVIPDSNSANDSKGDRLNVNEEIKITKGRYSGEFGKISHISSDSLFVKLSNETVCVQPDNIRKVREDAQKVDAEDIIGENIILLKKTEMSKPMKIQRLDTYGNIYVENIHNDESVKNHNFTVKLKDWSTKWMFETEIPVEMRFKDSNFRKFKKRSPLK